MHIAQHSSLDKSRLVPDKNRLSALLLQFATPGYEICYLHVTIWHMSYVTPHRGRLLKNILAHLSLACHHTVETLQPGNVSKLNSEK